MTERVTLITGASAGIGTELARVFASHGHRLALVARRGDRLEALAAEITASGGVAPIVIPCHRVLAAGGRLGGFSAYGGALTKERLLVLERARLL